MHILHEVAPPPPKQSDTEALCQPPPPTLEGWVCLWGGGGEFVHTIMHDDPS